MKERRLTMTPEFLVMMFSGPGAWAVTKNRLPEDARVVRAEVRTMSSVPEGIEGWQYLDLWITSSAFRDDDPEALPPVYYDAIDE